jgi:hypothetical protein
LRSALCRSGSACSRAGSRRRGCAATSERESRRQMETCSSPSGAPGRMVAWIASRPRPSSSGLAAGRSTVGERPAPSFRVAPEVARPPASGLCAGDILHFVPGSVLEHRHDRAEGALLVHLVASESACSSPRRRARVTPSATVVNEGGIRRRHLRQRLGRAGPGSACRHSFVSRLISTGIAPAAVAARAGTRWRARRRCALGSPP